MEKTKYLYEEKSRQELVQLIEDKNIVINALCEKISTMKDLRLAAIDTNTYGMINSNLKGGV